MTKIARKKLKCAKCGAESEQLIVYSVNFILGDQKSNEKLMRHQQVCPKCNYTNWDISFLSNNEDQSNK